MDLESCARGAVFVEKIMGGLGRFVARAVVLVSDTPTTLLRPRESAS